MATELAKAKQILVEGATDAPLQTYLDELGITITADGTKVTLGLTNGNSSEILSASTTDAGLQSATDKTKLDGLPEGTAIQNSLGSKVDKDGTKVLTDENFSSAEKTKLSDLPTASEISSGLQGKVDTEAGKGLIDPAPVDGKQYARKDNAWTEVEGGTGDVEEAPIDGKQYARKDAGWEEVASGGASALGDLSDVSLGTLSGGRVLTWDNASQMWTAVLPTIPVDAPSDGLAYVRSYNSWQPLNNYALTEAPTDGKLYGRSSGEWKEAPSFPTGSLASRPHWLKDGQTKIATLQDLTDVSWGTPSDGEVLKYNASTSKVEFGTGGSGGSGVEEAPNDSKPYVRMDNAWVVGVREPNTTNNTFSLRRDSSGNTSWVTALDPSNKKILIGPGASGHNSTFGGIAIGENSQSTKTGSVDVGSIAIGKAAKAYSQGDISIGAVAVTASHSGQGSSTQRDRTSIGTNASAVGIASIALGKEASSPNHNSVALGNGAATESDNEIRLGGVDAIVKTQSAVVVVSDERDKADIQEHGLGLEFIKLLRPVKWKNDPRASYSPQREDFETYEEYRLAKDSWDPSDALCDGSKKGQRFQYGLIAQQVKEAMDTLGVDFSGYKDDSVTAGGSGNKALAYTDFISPLILAVQQLSERVEALETQLGGQQGD